MNILSSLLSDMQLMFRRPARQQYAALCYRKKKKTGEIEVMLATSRDTGRWIIPKGWPMAGKSPYEAAAREALEEAGVIGTVDDKPLGLYTYRKVLKDGLTVACQVQVYALEVIETARKFKEKGERRIEWVSCATAAERVKEPELKALFLVFEKRLAEKAAAEGMAAE